MRFRYKAFLLTLFASTTTLTGFIIPTLSQHGSSTDPSFVALRNNSSLSCDGKSRLLEFGNDLGFSKEETDVLAKQKNWEQNYTNFKKQFEHKLLDPKSFSLTDVYNLFSGFQQSVADTVKLMNELQTQVNKANDIYPVESFQVPKVPQKLFGFVDQGFFPKLNPKGLNIADNVASLFEKYSLKQATLKDFDIVLEKKNDIVLEHKVRYNFALQFHFETTYIGSGGEINLQFALQASTTNFSSLEELQASFSKVGNNLTAQLFWKPVVNKLTSGENDLTHIAQTAVGESLFDSRVDLTSSIINNEAAIKTTQQQFETEVLALFKAEREKALAEYKAEQERIAKELEEQRKELERLKKEQQNKQELVESLYNVANFVSYWEKRGKDVTDKKQLIQALKSAFATNWNEVFQLLTAGMREGIKEYYKHNKPDQSANAKKAFGQNGLAFPRTGFDGIYMSDWLRGELRNKGNINLPLKQNETTVKKIRDDISIEWNESKGGIEFHQTYPYWFEFEVNFKYIGGYSLNWWDAIWAKVAGIPGSWKGEMNLKLVIDGEIHKWMVTKPDYPRTFFQFDDQFDKLWFTLHVSQEISVRDESFMNLLKKQGLDKLDLRTGSTKPPVVDLASYLHYLILADKS
ncbi:hypothetical protein BIX54_00265 [Mycoplasmoides pneumoniae]|uniref:DUF240 domain-containing protein n=1 Tax=Mycoplasmoides pneumoniae TaxID=2104 RepID=UPI0006A6D604|nr:DUF237 domain-containing protein [Mycoplasmoides pneumoniae]ALA29924.1 membrane protein [Mycoplasmoides pneumoniae PI 1428]ALA32038.1 membrane protein [Mycoplasmoides pneumoniae 51494]ALA32741.1 membrane protein [Mycoplasmoides pneumoniae 54089]ALA33444.1 membrane protein [Mycoplasmoides pneumoniae 54524]ALA34150.1 membrane protein [Mycoplasmoides pneumoniae 85084]